MRTTFLTLLVLLEFLVLPLTSAFARFDLVVSASATVTPTGPRSGRNGNAYFNVQAKTTENPSFASFGVLDFTAPQAANPSKVDGLSLAMTQSVARFSKDGKIRIFLAIDSSIAIKPSALKFDPRKADGIDKQLKELVEVGSGSFAKKKTGEVDVYPLKLDEVTKTILAKCLATGGTIRLIVVPDDAEVAATYFGAEQEKESSRPRLIIETAKP